ncbi:Root phototropism protein 3, partial [Mucuna pruriens]
MKNFVVNIPTKQIRSMWESESESAAGHKYGGGLLTSSNHGVKNEGFVQRGHSWYIATGIPSDFLVQIGEANFHLCKYPLVSRSGKLSRIIYESHDPDLNKMVMDDVLGGAETFELATKFCYGIVVDLTAGNISGLRCVAEYLEMIEDLEEGNHIFKVEAFLNYVVLSSKREDKFWSIVRSTWKKIITFVRKQFSIWHHSQVVLSSGLVYVGLFLDSQLCGQKPNTLKPARSLFIRGEG